MTGRARVLVAAAALAAFGCVDGPYARTNPYDPSTVVRAELIVVTDTVSVVGEVAIVQLVTEPTLDLEKYPPQWVSGQSAVLQSLGDGRYRLISVPATPTPVTVSAIYPAFTVQGVIVAGRP